jgi:hypothetical protein
LMTEPPAAPALELLAIDTGSLPVVPVLVVLVVVIEDYLHERKNPRAAAKMTMGGCLAAPTQLFRECLKLYQIDLYGSFCSRVRMFCGIVLAWATIAVLACCRIWAFDRLEVACA